jgi:KEOPS complex subunit Pcc1
MRFFVARHQAVFRFRSDHANQIFKALQPELPDEVNPRSSTRCVLDGTDTLVLMIEAQDTASLRAALNMYLRLVNVADEVVSLVEKP